MIKILIVDDVEEGRDQAQAALLPVTGNHNYQEERRILASELFDITRCTIAGEAIKAIEKYGLRPDLAIVDVDFQGLDSNYVKEEGFDPKEEMSNLRGFDVLETLHKYAPATTVVLFTGKADQDDMIAEELRRRDLRQGRSYFIKTSRAIGINELSVHLADCTQQLAVHLGELATQEERNQIRTTLDLPDDQFLDQDISLGNRTIALKSLLAFAALYNHTDNSIVFNNAKAQLSEIFSLQRIENFEPNGIWQQDCIHQAILDWRSYKAYQMQNQEIDKDAANYVLNAILYGTPIDIVNRTNLTAHVNRNRRYRHNDNFDATLINALKLRRALLGLSRLAQQPVWGQGHNRVMDRVLDYFMEMNNLGTNPDNMRNFLSQVRGLSIGTLNLPQSLSLDPLHILQEERLWLEKYPDLIVRKIRGDKSTF